MVLTEESRRLNDMLRRESAERERLTRELENKARVNKEMVDDMTEVS